MGQQDMRPPRDAAVAVWRGIRALTTAGGPAEALGVTLGNAVRPTSIVPRVPGAAMDAQGARRSESDEDERSDPHEMRELFLGVAMRSAVTPWLSQSIHIVGGTETAYGYGCVWAGRGPNRDHFSARA